MLYNITRYLTKDIQIGKGSIFFLMIPPLKIKLNKIAKGQKNYHCLLYFIIISIIYQWFSVGVVVVSH